MDPVSHLYARLFVGFGQRLCRTVLTAVDCRPLLLIKIHSGVNHGLRFERRGCAVEVTLPLRQCRELSPKISGVKSRHAGYILRLQGKEYKFELMQTDLFILGMVTWKYIRGLLC